MIYTILEGHVTSEKWEQLEEAYKRGIKTVPHQLVQSFLLQSKTDPDTWMVISLWRDEEEYNEAHKAGHTSVCVEMFHSVGVEPKPRRVLEVVAHHMHVWGSSD
ncbi:MAG: antibiotic biosynthesis monooxygenase [Anaerolineaceae bacterium]|jgi:quinol monooxygenase YgiN